MLNLLIDFIFDAIFALIGHAFFFILIMGILGALGGGALFGAPGWFFGFVAGCVVGYLFEAALERRAATAKAPRTRALVIGAAGVAILAAVFVVAYRSWI